MELDLTPNTCMRENLRMGTKSIISVRLEPSLEMADPAPPEQHGGPHGTQNTWASISKHVSTISSTLWAISQHPHWARTRSKPWMERKFPRIGTGRNQLILATNGRCWLPWNIHIHFHFENLNSCCFPNSPQSKVHSMPKVWYFHLSILLSGKWA